MRRIAWSIFWKFTLVTFPAALLVGAVLGGVVGFVGYLAGFDHESVILFAQILSAVAGLFVSFIVFTYFLARSIGRDIGGKRLELVVAEGV
jgi:ABC-type uncharacterized transport system fused permease/ATPase subunit